MDAPGMSALALKLALVALLAAGLNACVLVGPPASGAKAGHDVVLCHKGKKTMTLPQEAAQGHIGHGDHYGPC